MGENSLEKFQNLLRTLFQFDYADLDFGIYRVLNYKRKQIEEFITKRLPESVETAFAKYSAAERGTALQEQNLLQDKIIKDWGTDAFNGKGQLKFEVRDKPIGKQYLATEEKAKAIQVAEELKIRTYNDLYTFFSRYYEEGDFVSKRRYGRNETYAIPYKGEEVMLHWANRDQYYVKTGENFKTYRFRAGDFTVAFQLRDVTIESSEQNKKRYFILAKKDVVTWDADTKILTIFMEHRSLTESEEKEHGKTEQQKPQDKLNEAAEKLILEHVKDGGLKFALAKNEKRNSKEKSVLRWRLDHFSHRNTADFFIHKDLCSFLQRELDFFIKNEVLQLDELVGGKEEDLKRHLQRGRVVKDIAQSIIDFLAQVEDFQKKMFEKKKFVIRTEYCLTIDRIPEALWGEILANKAQVAEWRELYALDEKLNKALLKAHPTLTIDTRHFDEDFKLRFLAQFDNLDEMIDGVLMKSENWQALNLLIEKYRQQVNCIYIDPPYNTNASPILYKNGYRDSSWLALMDSRIHLGKSLLRRSGIQCTTIDDTEFHKLRELISLIFGEENIAGVVTIKNNPSGRSTVKGFSIAHEYAIFSLASEESLLGMIPRTPEQAAQYSEKDEQGLFQYRSFMRSGGANDFRTARPKLHYPLVVYGDKVRLPRLEWNSTQNKWELAEKLDQSDQVLLPITNGVEYTWRLGVDSLRKRLGDLRLRIAKDGKQMIEIKFRIDEEGILPKTVWDDKYVNATAYGTTLLRHIIGVPQTFSFPKSIYAVRNSLTICGAVPDSIVLDYFAGSGTTAHAVIDLNRQDGGKRKYILVESGDWFETVMLPRIKKVVFCEKWKNGKPVGGNGISHFIKYQYVEQYEDTLNNLELPRQAEGQRMLEICGDEYLLKYMLDSETQGSPCLLNLDRFKNPFAYKLRVQERDEIRECTIDLVETFNYLLGIKVKKIMAFEDSGRPYRAILGEKNGNRLAIVWRPTTTLENNNEALMRDKSFIEKTILPALLGEAKPDRVLINGISFVEGAEAIEPEFKRLMFSGVV